MIHLHPGRDQALVLRTGDNNHLPSVFFSGGAGMKRIISGGKDIYPIQPDRFDCAESHLNLSLVNRIKNAFQNTNTFFGQSKNPPFHLHVLIIIDLYQ